MSAPADVRPSLPLGVDPKLKRVPGMEIDFADYRERVQEFFEAMERVGNAGPPADPAEVARINALALDLDPHDVIFHAWANEQRERAFRLQRWRIWGTLGLAIAISVGYLTVLANRTFHFW